MSFFAGIIAGVSVVSGLEWRTLAGPAAPAREIRDIAAEISASRIVQVRSGGVTNCGFLPDERLAEVKGRAFSLAALFAGMPDIGPDSLFVFETNEGAFIAGVRSGVPAPGFDGYGATEDIVDTAQRFLQFAPAGTQVYGNCSALAHIPMTLDDVVQKSSKRKLAQLGGMTSPLVRYALLGAAVLLVGGGSLYAYNLQAEKARIAESQLGHVDVEGEYARSVQPLFAVAVPAKPSVRMVAGLLGSTPVVIGGWGLTEIVCQKDGCSYVWKNMFGTNRTFEPPAGVQELKYSNKGDAIAYQLAYPKPLPVGLDISRTPTLEQILRDVTGDLQEFQEFELAQTFDAPTDFGVPPGLPSTPAQVFKEGTYSISGPWYALEAVSKLPDAATLETFRIRFEGEHKINFNITGKYYVK